MAPIIEARRARMFSQPESVKVTQRMFSGLVSVSFRM